MATRTHASPKADFILGLPSSLPVAEVVARAAAAGMSLSGSMVRKTRAAGAPSGSSRRRAAPAAAKQRAADRSETPRPAVRARPGSKRAFVLSFADDTPAGEIVTAAKAKGFQLPTGYVYWVRSDAARKARQSSGQDGQDQTKRASGIGPATRRPTRGATSRDGRRGAADPQSQAQSIASTRSATSSPTNHREAEGLLIQTAIRVVGIERAIELLKAARERIHRLLQD